MASWSVDVRTTPYLPDLSTDNALLSRNGCMGAWRAAASCSGFDVRNNDSVITACSVTKVTEKYSENKENCQSLYIVP
jgi:hypothetical protein